MPNDWIWGEDGGVFFSENQNDLAHKNTTAGN